jgi:hypothetical protein
MPRPTRARRAELIIPVNVDGTPRSNIRVKKINADI